jgi:hypothetical protein
MQSSTHAIPTTIFNERIQSKPVDSCTIECCENLVRSTIEKEQRKRVYVPGTEGFWKDESADEGEYADGNVNDPNIDYQSDVASSKAVKKEKPVTATPSKFKAFG